MSHLVSRACGTLTVIDADTQDDFCFLVIAVQSFYEAYSREISANESWDDCQATFGYQLETLRSHGRPRFVLTGCQMEAFQQRQYSWRAMASTLRVSYGTILRRRYELGMAVGEQFSRISDELQAIYAGEDCVVPLHSLLTSKD